MGFVIDEEHLFLVVFDQVMEGKALKSSQSKPVLLTIEEIIPGVTARTESRES